MSDPIHDLYSISGDIAQLCNQTEVVYFHAKKPVTMVVNVFNASSSCIITARLKDSNGNVLVSETINHRVSAPDPALPGQTVVINQQKSLASTGVTFLTISCECDPTIVACNMTTLCSGRYTGEVTVLTKDKD
ncbi:hypothetical protein RB620_21440 [Paenibacillus sp. LHD-117]|uniref:hypothetical protein n=1 Tax=Paenibacillus sp. LHD-117 TaxID=3071412 RepID=UPI0027DF8741|nr:hypothetical protein [Paenibacillus sp. LHD-117]MDQ6421998.1 hypothetical protein [Paenibacillus sp. LHD-117]